VNHSGSSIVPAAGATPPAGARVPQTRLGRSSLLASRLGLGLAALGRPAYMAPGRDTDLGHDRSIETMRQHCHAMLDAAYTAGVRYVDAARSYGCAEQFVNAWWTGRRLPDTALTVGSKWGYVYRGQWQLDAPLHEVKDHSIGALRHQLTESRTILGRRLSLYQIHSADSESGVLDDRAVLSELIRLREQGLCVGLTVTGPRQRDVIHRALDTRADGVTLFDTVQATWNLLEPSAGDALADAHREGWGVIVKEALANGRLTNRFGGPELRDIRVRAADLGTAVETLAMAAALAQPWADVVLSGAVTRGQLDAHVAACAMALEGSSLPALAESPDLYWRRRAALTWS
jgi:aryl-alcohol dehydrogenase-like predicted oxidoreductase